MAFFLYGLFHWKKKAIYNMYMAFNSRKKAVPINSLFKANKKAQTCKQCDYKTSNHLKLHLCIHSVERPFICTQCNQSWKTAGHLKCQMATHSREKSLTCKNRGYSLFLCKGCDSEKKHTKAFRGEAIHLHTMQSFLHNTKLFKRTCATNLFRGEAIQICTMQIFKSEGIHASLKAWPSKALK